VQIPALTGPKSKLPKVSRILSAEIPLYD